MNGLKRLLRWTLTRLYKVEVEGLENLEKAGDKVLIVANHTSFLDAVLLGAFLPGRLTFAVNTVIARAWYLRLARLLFGLFPMDPANALSMRALIKRLNGGGRVVIFPEGRITVTGALMKIYPGPGLVADRTGASVLPVRIDGAQYTPFSRMKGRVRQRRFPKIKLTIMAPRRIEVATQVRGRERRRKAGQVLADIMTEMMFQTSDRNKVLLDSLLDARRIHGGRHVILEDVERRPMTYNQLLARIAVLGRALGRNTQTGETVGVLLPNSLAAAVTFFALQRERRVPALLNFSTGVQGMLSACHTARIDTVITARRFVEKARLDDVVTTLGERVRIIYLEDLAKRIGALEKLSGFITSRFDGLFRRRYAQAACNDPAVVLFTSGSEGTPKGVVLSHANIQANRAQLSARVDFNARDVVLNALPMFHSFGLTAATILPVLSGMKTFLYPSPLHYRIIPEIAYAINATLMFGTSTFLAGYARFAHDYDFSSLRYVFAGAEKLKDEVRRAWESRFGVKVFEGYGATETTPVLAANTPMEKRSGTVGRLLPGIEYHIDPVPGIDQGGRLYVRGPNVMRGYYLHDQPGQLVPPQSDHGEGWYDTGDIVEMDADGYVAITGRAKRFAKVGGEMVSLAGVEALAAKAWPGEAHAVVAIPDAQKGEQLVLLTEQPQATRGELLAAAKAEGIGEINVPRTIIPAKAIPVLGTGKIDYVGVYDLVKEAKK